MSKEAIIIIILTVLGLIVSYGAWQYPATQSRGTPNVAPITSAAPSTHNSPKESKHSSDITKDQEPLKKVVDKSNLDLAELYNKRQFDEIIKHSDVLTQNVGFRIRAKVLIMKGEIEKSLLEYDLQNLKANGYPSNIQYGYYAGWNSLSLVGDTLFIRDQGGKALANFKISEYIKDEIPSTWSLKEMEIIRSLLDKYEVQHPFCCLRKFLIDDYTPTDIFDLIEIDLLLGNYEQANKRLNLLRLIDWEASFTEVEMLSVTANLLQKYYKVARDFVYTNTVGFNALRYGNAINAFIEMSVNYDTNQFDRIKQLFDAAMHSYQVQFPFDLHDGYFAQPVLEKWLSNLGNSGRAVTLIDSWQRLKAKHGMTDFYSYMYQVRNQIKSTPGQ